VIWLILLVFVWLPGNALAYLLAPILPRYAVPVLGPADNNNAIRTEPRLTGGLSVFQTPDNSLYGDAGWREIHCPDWQTNWGMTKWLWRNPAAGLDLNILGAAIKPSDRLRVLGSPLVSDGPHGKAGVCFTMLGWYWNLCAVIRWTASTCTKLDFGWQLKTYAEDPRRIISQPLARYAFTIRLLIKFVTTG